MKHEERLYVHVQCDYYGERYGIVKVSKVRKAG